MCMSILVAIGSVIRNFVSTPGAFSPPRGAGGHDAALVMSARNPPRIKTFPTTHHLWRSVRWFRQCDSDTHTDRHTDRRKTLNMATQRDKALSYRLGNAEPQHAIVICFSVPIRLRNLGIQRLYVVLVEE